MAEINSLTIGNKDSELNSTALFSDSNLQGYWRLESDGTDSSSNGYTLTGTDPAYTTGKFGNGGDFESSSSQYLSIADASCPNLEISGSQTWSAWVKIETANVTQVIASKYEASTNVRKLLQLYWNGSQLKAHFWLQGLSANQLSDQNLSIGTWYHIAGVYDSSAGKIKVFVNGVKTESSVTGTPTDSNADFAIGCDHSGGSDAKANFLDGIADDVAVFDRALTDAEILTLCDHTREGYWRMESGALTTDSSGNGNTLTAVNSPTEVVGKYGGAVDLEFSSSQCMYAADSASLSITGSMSLSLWVNFETLPSVIGGQVGLINKWKSSDNNRSFQFNFDSSNRLEFLFSSDGTAGSVYTHFRTDSALGISVGTWYHIGLTIDPTNDTCVFYLDGVPVASSTITNGSATSIFDSSTAVVIGGRFTTSFELFMDGMIDDAAIFSRVLTDAEVLQLFNEKPGGNVMFFNGSLALG